ncbi:hypothetical protein HA466_0293780 [Hirschfeldia incana]|nr:hypothetical protein HA466_0293780 [Hirschfeldia incana]
MLFIPFSFSLYSSTTTTLLHLQYSKIDKIYTSHLLSHTSTSTVAETPSSQLICLPHRAHLHCHCCLKFPVGVELIKEEEEEEEREKERCGAEAVVLADAAVVVVFTVNSKRRSGGEDFRAILLFLDLFLFLIKIVFFL